MFLASPHFSCSAFHSKAVSTYSYRLLCFQSFHCFCLCKHIHSHAHCFLKWMKASWQHVTTNPVAAPIVGAQYCWMRTIKKKKKETWLHIGAERMESDIASQKPLAVIFLSECCDGVLFSTPQGTKTSVHQTIHFLSQKLKVPVWITKKTWKRKQSKTNFLRSFSCLGMKKKNNQS